MGISDFLHKHNSSITITLAFTFGAVTATTAIFTSFAIRRRNATRELKDSIPELSESHHAYQLTEFGAASPEDSTSGTPRVPYSKEDERAAKIAARARKGEYDEELILEQLARNRVFLKDDGLAKLRGSFVVVIGLGGVGSHCVAALARSGVERIRIVDFDQVTLSSLNRHALATLADVGAPKVQCVRRRMEQICPWVRIEARNELFNISSAERLLGSWDFELRGGEEEGKKPDFVVDAIDNIDSKVGLLQYCVQRGLKVVSAMGAGCKSDPTRICVGDISTSTEDPLSKSTRRRLRLLGIEKGVPVVYSTEKPGEGKAQLLPIAQEEFEKGNVGDLGVLPDFRVRILPVLGTMPAVFGYTVANYVICSISGYPMDYHVGEKGREKMYDSMLASLHGMEERLVKQVGSEDTVGLRTPISRDDVAYLVEEVFRGKSVISGLSTRLVLVRWRKPDSGFKLDKAYEKEGQKSVKMAFSDLVLMTKEEAQAHEKKVLRGDKSPEDVYEPNVLEVVARRHADQKAFDRYR